MSSEQPNHDALGTALGDRDIDPVTGEPPRPAGAGMYLHWDGRKSYRTRMPAPRVLEPVDKLSYGEDDGNLIIEGDNLQAMVSLRSQYRATVDIAYVDPPYNTGRKDFRYSDRRFQDPNAASDDAVYVNNEDGGRHTKWLNFMGPRLHLIHELLAPHGVCFVSISDVELFHLGMLLDEIFNPRNRLGVVVWKGAIENNPTHIASEHEYVLCYAKQEEAIARYWRGESDAKQWLLDTYNDLRSTTETRSIEELQRAFQSAIERHIEARKQDIRKSDNSELVDLGRAARYRFIDERGVYAAEDNTHKPTGGYFYDVIHPVTGKPCKKPETGYRFLEDTMNRLRLEDRLVFGKDHRRQVQIKKYLTEVYEPLRSVLSIPAKLGKSRLKRLLGADAAARYPHPKPVALIERLIVSTGYEDALVLDPFAGSGTTADAVLRRNTLDGGRRRFILIEEGTPSDPYCRTLTAPRVQAAIEDNGVRSGFTFLETGQSLNREAILELERRAIASLIVQSDVTGAARGITRLDGEHVIGFNARREGICLRWNGRADSTISAGVLSEMFAEARKLKLNKPLRVYGSTCTVGETESFRFCQIPDEIMAALNLDDEEPANLNDIAENVETLETATIP